jgi:hypothetical protein
VSANRERDSSFPIFDWLFGYQKEWLRWDLIAGLITAAVVIPKAMAYATESTWVHNRNTTNRAYVNSFWIPLRRWASWTQASLLPTRNGAAIFPA